MSEIAEQTRLARERLYELGWKQISEDGTMADLNGVVWFSTGYAHGEYTFHASYRERGSGPARSPIKVRITVATVNRYPEAGIILAEDLNEAADLIAVRGFEEALKHAPWPPATWAEVGAL